MEATSSTAFPERMTYGDKYGPAMAITDQAEADAYFERCVEHCMAFGGKSRGDAETVERSNLGYFAGYYNAETMERVNRLFKTTHPIFGGTIPTPEEAFELGKSLGTAAAAGELER